jgi:hypothetical protein
VVLAVVGRIFSPLAVVVTVSGTEDVVLVHLMMRVMEGRKAVQLIVIILTIVVNVREYVVVLWVLILLNALEGLTAVVRNDLRIKRGILIRKRGCLAERPRF